MIPLFDIWTFPQSDYSLQTWVNRLSMNVDEGRDADTMAELDLMKEFYQNYVRRLEKVPSKSLFCRL